MVRSRKLLARTTALLAVASLLASCGGSSDEDLRRARAEGAREQRLRTLERELRDQKKQSSKGAQSPSAAAPSGSGSSAPSSGRTPCPAGGGVAVGPNTTCAFAQAVKDAYPNSGESFEVYSPATKQTYTMSCTQGSPHVCTGGNNASVSFP
jgi:hypothetical protein